MNNRRWLVAIACAAAFILPLIGQTTTATLLGVLRDSSGGVIPAARVTARNMDTGFTRSSTSDDTGSYLITNLPVGRYSLTAELEGFQQFVQDGITLEVNQNARVDVMLSVGQITETVHVTAESIGVETRSSTIGEVVDRTRIQELPLNGRNAMELARVVPGVVRVNAPTVVTNARKGPRP